MSFRKFGTGAITETDQSETSLARTATTTAWNETDDEELADENREADGE